MSSEQQKQKKEEAPSEEEEWFDPSYCLTHDEYGEWDDVEGCFVCHSCLEEYEDNEDCEGY